MKDEMPRFDLVSRFAPCYPIISQDIYKVIYQKFRLQFY